MTPTGSAMVNWNRRLIYPGEDNSFLGDYEDVWMSGAEAQIVKRWQCCCGALTSAKPSHVPMTTRHLHSKRLILPHLCGWSFHHHKPRQKIFWTIHFSITHQKRTIIDGQGHQNHRYNGECK